MRVPITAASLLQLQGLRVEGPVLWGTEIVCNRSGIYVVALPGEPRQTTPISRAAIGQWLNKADRLQLDGQRPATEALVERLAEFWSPDETILYIGQTSGQSLQKRVNQFYKHQLGDRRPHRGGDWLKALAVLSELHVYYAVSEEPKSVEQQLLCSFMNQVSPRSRQVGALPIPFANKEVIVNGRRLRKQHGLSRAAH